MARPRNRSIPNVIRNNAFNSFRVVRPAIHYRNRVPVIPVRRSALSRLQHLSFSPVPAPRRQQRQAQRSILKLVNPKKYEQVHDCKKEFSRLLSWRSAQGSGRKRSKKELVNNRKSFNRKDC